MESITILVNSDLHFDEGVITDKKKDSFDKINQLCKKETIDAMICAGDLTNNGHDGKSFLCWAYGGTDDELSPLKDYIGDINGVIANVLLCMGNHDNYVPWPHLHKGVRNYIIGKHGSLYYTKYIKGYRFVCLNVYPDKYGQAYLTTELMSGDIDVPTILFWHYNLTGQWSEWWSDEDKEKVGNIINESRANVVLIIVGHAHTNRKTEWNGIPVVSGANYNFVKCKIIGNDIQYEEIL